LKILLYVKNGWRIDEFIKSEKTGKDASSRPVSRDLLLIAFWFVGSAAFDATESKLRY